MIKEIVFCILGSLFFAVTMKAPVFCMPYIFIGSAITATTERILSGRYGDLVACTIAMFTLSIFGELVSRSLKIPAIAIVMPSTIPLLPGSAIYYAMFYGLQGNSTLFSSYLKSTIMTGLGIALGAIVSSIFTKLAIKQ